MIYELQLKCGSGCVAWRLRCRCNVKLSCSATVGAGFWGATRCGCGRFVRGVGWMERSLGSEQIAVWGQSRHFVCSDPKRKSVIMSALTPKGLTPKGFDPKRVSPKGSRRVHPQIRPHKIRHRQRL